MKKKIFAITFFCTALLLWGVVINGDLNVLGTLTATIVNFTSADSTAPMKSGTTLPSSCSVGQAFFKTDATAGQNIYLCTATNTWTQVQGGGGGGSFDYQPSTRYISLSTDFTPTADWNIGSPAALGDFRFIRIQGSQNLNNPSSSNNVADRAGHATISTTTTANDYAVWYIPIIYDLSTTGTLYHQTDKNWVIEIIFKLPDSSDLSNIEGFVGLFGSAAMPSPGIGLAFKTSSNNNFNWASVSDSNVWPTLVGAGVALDTNWHKIKIRSDGTTVKKMYFSLDEGTEVDACESGCTLTRADYLTTSWGARIGFGLRTTDTVQKKLAIDYTSFWMDRGATR